MVRLVDSLGEVGMDNPPVVPGRMVIALDSVRGGMDRLHHTAHAHTVPVADLHAPLPEYTCQDHQETQTLVYGVQVMRKAPSPRQGQDGREASLAILPANGQLRFPG